MAGQYELRKFLQHVSNPILKEYFERIEKEYFERIKWNVGVDWAKLTARETGPLFEAIQNAPDDIRGRINEEFQQINDMATEGGVKALIDEGRQWTRGELDLAGELKDIAGLHNKVFSVFLNHPAEGSGHSVFDVARGFNRADKVSNRSWRKRSGVPTIEHAKSKEDEIARRLDDGRKRLGDSLQSYYRVKEGRGYGCEVHHFERDDKLYWFAYVRDYDRISLEWTDYGLAPRESKPVFEVIFVHSNTTQSLDIYVKGDAKTAADLQKLWARAILDTDDLGTPPERGVEYELNLLKTKRELPFQHVDGIMAVRISALRLSLMGDKKNRRVTLEANTRNDPKAVYTLLDKMFKMPGHSDGASDEEDPRPSLDVVNVTQAVITFVFAADTRTGTKTIVARVSYPNSCNLKFEPKEEIARNYLREWGIDVSKSTQSNLSGD